MAENPGEWNGVYDAFSDPEEKRVLFAALDSFRQYRRTAHLNVTHRRRQNFYALPTTQWQMLADPPFNFLSNLELVDEAIDANANIASAILATGLQSFGLSSEPEDPAMDWRGAATPSDMNKARSTIRQLYRDWSADGIDERRACYEPVIQDVAQEFASCLDRAFVRVLVPGAGLGRLVFELCRRGYTVEGNEISYHQLIASNWALNHTTHAGQFDLYPFALEFSNVVRRDDQLRVVKVPDVHPGLELEKASEGKQVHAFERMSMMAADFVTIYGDENHRSMFDAVVTVFFIDTAPNFIRYIEVVRNCLKSTGVWINLGPLLWHFGDRGPTSRNGGTETEAKKQRSGIEEPGSIELTEEEQEKIDEPNVRDHGDMYNLCAFPERAHICSCQVQHTVRKFGDESRLIAVDVDLGDFDLDEEAARGEA
ncbi:hypothetical protein MMC22_003718 [Lobaria immixta]|nr:hypothetical protein [Lobaria immixta]